MQQASCYYLRELNKNKILESIKEKIEDSSFGYMFFDEFMEISLYSSNGYYNFGQLRSSKKGDFLTSPEVSEYFGKTISNWISSNFSNPVLNVLELGAGSGNLAKSINDSKKEKELDFYFIEKSDTAISSLKSLFPESFISKSIEDFSFAESNNLIVIGNEILDNIPCAIALIDNGHWKEKAIKMNKGSLDYCLVEPREAVLDWLSRNYKNDHPDFEVEVQINAELYIRDIIEKLNPLGILLFDYGYLQEARESKPYTSLLRTYKEHHIGPDPLLYPGETDITYDINFSSLIEVIDDKYYEKKICTQYEFLHNNGLNQYIEELIDRRSSKEGLDLIKNNSDLLSIKTISDKSGLGSFYTIQATRK